MNVVISPFRLLDLPGKALQNALQKFEVIEKIGFSLLSKRTKNLVVSSNLKARCFRLWISYGLRFHIRLQDYTEEFTMCFYKEEARDRAARLINPISLQTPDSVCISSQNHRMIWNGIGLEIKDWINRLFEILNYSKVNRIYFERNIFNCKSICDIFNKFEVNEIYIFEEFSEENCQMIFRLFPFVKRLCLCHNSFQDSKTIHKTFNQNFDALSYGSFWNSFEVTIKLDDLLMINSVIIELYSPSFSEKEVNQFIKHWINGSNRRMEYMSIQLPRLRIFNEEDILKRVDYQIIPQGTERLFIKPVIQTNGFNTVQIQGGFDFQRKDGRKATIIGNYYGPHYTMEFCIWP